MFNFEVAPEPPDNLYIIQTENPLASVPSYVVAVDLPGAPGAALAVTGREQNARILVASYNSNMKLAFHIRAERPKYPIGDIKGDTILELGEILGRAGMEAGQMDIVHVPLPEFLENMKRADEFWGNEDYRK